MKEITLNDYLKTQLKNPSFKKEWGSGEASYQVTKALIESRIKGNVSQRELAKRAGTTQAVISRIENMSVSPSIKMLERIARSIGKKLEIKFN